jgi:hypothetical protein
MSSDGVNGLILYIYFLILVAQHILDFDVFGRIGRKQTSNYEAGNKPRQLYKTKSRLEEKEIKGVAS